MLDEALHEHVVLAKVALKVDHFVQDILVICLRRTEALCHIVVGTGEMVDLRLEALDGTNILDRGGLGNGGYILNCGGFP